MFCVFCKKPTKRYVDCCVRVKIEREKKINEIYNKSKEMFLKRFLNGYTDDSFKPNVVLCKDCKKPTKGTYRCDSCKAKWDDKWN